MMMRGLRRSFFMPIGPDGLFFCGGEEWTDAAEGQAGVAGHSRCVRHLYERN